MPSNFGAVSFLNKNVFNVNIGEPYRIVCINLQNLTSIILNFNLEFLPFKLF